jgi:hypothetical protein
MRRSSLIPLVICLLTVLPVEAAEPTVLAVIVPQAYTGGTLSTAELSLIFLRKKLYWKDGRRIQPVNLAPENPLRRKFSHAVLGSLPESQTEYWNIQYYHGISPPHVVSSQEAMLRFVAETPGAVGYIDVCMVDMRVKAIAWIGEDGLTGTRPLTTCKD